MGFIELKQKCQPSKIVFRSCFDNYRKPKRRRKVCDMFHSTESEYWEAIRKWIAKIRHNNRHSWGALYANWYKEQKIRYPYTISFLCAYIDNIISDNLLACAKVSVYKCGVTD